MPALARQSLVVAVLVGLLAGWGVAQARRDVVIEVGPRLVFSHQKHVGGVGLACTDCHSKQRDHRVPAEDTCAGCHDSTRGGLDPSCPMCHAGVDDASSLEKGDSLRRGEGMAPELWACVARRYEHAAHAEQASCSACHPRAGSSSRAEDVLYPTRHFSCGLCHDDDPCEGIRLPTGAPPAPSTRVGDAS